MKKTIYKITVLNWDKYNGTLKKGHKKIMVSTGFLTDAKIRALSPVTRLLYLSCLLVAGESTSSHIEVSHESLVFQSGVKSGSLQSQLDLLQSLQLVRYESNAPLLNRKEKKIKEENRTYREVVPEDKLAKKYRTEVNRKAWSSYSEAYFKRYHVEPTRNGMINSMLSNFVKRVGEVDSPQVLEFYVWHKDSFYVKNTHSLRFALRDAESLHTQWKKGHAITQTDMRNYEKKQVEMDTFAKLDRNEI